MLHDYISPNGYALALRAASGRQQTPEESLAEYAARFASERTAALEATSAAVADEVRLREAEALEFRAAALTDLVAYEPPDPYGLRKETR
jgi:hypothetical protein